MKVLTKQLRLSQPIATIGLIVCAALWLHATQAKDAGFIWQINKGDATVYIAPTIHILSKDNTIPLAYQKLYRVSQTIVFETDIWNYTESEYDFSIEPAVYKEQLSETTTQGVRAICQAGRQCEAWFSLKPAILCSTLTIHTYHRYGYESRYGIDSLFVKRALFDGKKMHHLESLERQLDSFNAIAPQYIEPYLHQCVLANTEGLPEYDEGLSQFRRVIAAFEQADPDGIYEILHQEWQTMKSKTPQLEEYYAQLYARHDAWVAPIKELLKGEGTSLVLVGAAHLLLEDSLLDRLRQGGLDPQPLTLPLPVDHRPHWPRTTKDQP